MKRFVKLCFAILFMIVSITACGGDKGGGDSTTGTTTPPSHVDTSPDTTLGEHIYMADAGNTRIGQMDDMTGAGWVTLGSRGTGSNQFGGPEGYSPTGIFVDTAGRIYAADKTNYRIVRMDNITGTGWTALNGAHNDSFILPTSVFVDGAGKIYVADMGNSRIVRIDDMAGAGWTTFGTNGSGVNQFNRPIAVFVDASGKIYVVDQGNSRIVRMDDMTGAGWTSVGTRGSGPGQFGSPAGIFVDGTGKIFVSDASIFDETGTIEVVRTNRVVSMNDMTGTGWTTFGSTGNDINQFMQPAGIFVDSSGRIYVVDQYINRIVRINDMSGAGWRTAGCYGRVDTPPPPEFGPVYFDGIRAIFIR